MNKIFLFTCVLISLHQANAQDGALPKILLKRPDGSKVYASQINNNGKPFIVSFWATWCKFCLNEFNTIAVFYSKWQAEDSVKIVAISTDTEPKKGYIKNFIEKRNWQYEFYIDDKQSLSKHFNIEELPHTLIIGSSGKVLWEKVGFNPGDQTEIINAYRQIKSTLNYPKHE